MSTDTEPANAVDGARGELSQTLNRGVSVLYALTGGPKSTTELAEELGLYRSVVHRLVTTLAFRGLVVRMGDGRFALGLGVLILGSSVGWGLRDVARPHLQRLADTALATVTLTVSEHGESVNLLTAEPSEKRIYVSVPPGLRHPLELGADGHALLAAEPPRPGESASVTAARERGWAVSAGEMTPGVAAVAMAFPVDGVGVHCAVSVITLEERLAEDQEALVAAVRVAVDDIRSALERARAEISKG